MAAALSWPFCHPMKRTHTCIAAAGTAFTACALFLAASANSRPHLTILVNGSPAANVTVSDVQTGTPHQTDSTGTLNYSVRSGKQNAVFVPISGGGIRMVSFPPRGHRTIDIRGRYTRSTTVVYDFGLLRREQTTVQHDLTDAEAAAARNRGTMLRQVENLTRNPAEP